MIDERTEAQASLYVLGALPADEARKFERTLRADLQLQLFVGELRSTSCALALAFPRVDPPPALKHRILAAVEHSAATAGSEAPAAAPVWIPWVLAACFAILCVSLLVLGQSLRQQTITTQDQLQEARQQIADLEDRGAIHITDYAWRESNRLQTISLLQTQLVQRAEELKRQKQTFEQQVQQAQAETERQKGLYVAQIEQTRMQRDALQARLDGVTVPDQDIFAQLRVAALDATVENPSRAVGAVVWNNAEQRGVLQTDNLAMLSPASDYQLWVFDPQYPTPVSGGTFRVDPSGAVRVQFQTVARINQAQRFAVSIERRGGAAVPTQGRVVLISN